MIKTGKRLNKKRTYSEEFKRKLFSDFESDIASVKQLERQFGIKNAVIYRWIYKYSNYNEKNVTVAEMKDSQTNRIKELEKQIAQLEQSVGQKQIKIDFLEKMIELAKDYYDIDIKKNCSTPPSGDSKTTDKK
ncbi:MAG: transposase [Flavobacteriales bacterium]|nr:transposase [Flavobacteriales bacterium]